MRAGTLFLLLATACSSYEYRDPLEGVACAGEASGDADGDGICDEDDICADGDDAVDGDGDGVPDACDACPADDPDDTDGDGICDSEDSCPEGHDAYDEDDDGVADACDPCPNDGINDEDGDGVCSADDPCPLDPDDLCGHEIRLWMKVDTFASEASWELTHGEQVIDSGDFPVSQGVVERTYTIPAGSDGCVTVYDTYGDGGVQGYVQDETLGVRLASWADDYGSKRTTCFTVGS